MCTRLVTLQKQWAIIKPYIIKAACIQVYYGAPLSHTLAHPVTYAYIQIKPTALDFSKRHVDMASIAYRSETLSYSYWCIFYIIQNQTEKKYYHKQQKKKSFINYMGTFHLTLMFGIRCYKRSSRPLDASILLWNCFIANLLVRCVWTYGGSCPFRFSNLWLVFISFLINNQINLEKTQRIWYIAIEWSVCAVCALMRFVEIRNNNRKWIWDKWNWVDFCNISFDFVTILLDSSLQNTSSLLHSCLFSFHFVCKGVGQ